MKHVLRVEVRWAPKDFNKLQSSKAMMFTRLFAPILSSFNTTHSWVVEWQTDQMAKTKLVEATQVDQFLSIRRVASNKHKRFYFSFRLSATGAQFIQVLKSKEFQSIKRGEGISFDPSVIPQTQGEVTYVGGILLKDAKPTHRGQYLAYLRSAVLPPDVPAFDLKVKHKDPSGVKIQILTVRCGKHVATQVAQILSSFLNGEGTYSEIFISRLALGANRITRGDQDRIYQVHRDYMTDIDHLHFCQVNKSTYPSWNTLTLVHKSLAPLDNGRKVSATVKDIPLKLTCKMVCLTATLFSLFLLLLWPKQR